MTSSIENGSSVDSLRDDSITPEYDKLIGEYTTLASQVDAVDTDLSAKLPELLGKVKSELAQFSTAPSGASYDQVKGALKADLSLEDKNYVALLQELYTTTLSLQQEYTSIQAIRKTEQTEYTTKIQTETAQESTPIKSRLQTVDVKQYTTITIAGKKKRDKPTEKSAFEVSLDASVVEGLTNAENILETAKNGLFSAQAALEANRTSIIKLTDSISTTEANIQKKKTEISLNDISMKNNTDTQNSTEVQRLSALNQLLNQEIIGLQATLDGPTGLKQLLIDEKGKTVGLEGSVNTANTVLIEKQAAFAVAFEAQQDAYNTAIEGVLGNIQQKILVPVNELKQNIGVANSTLTASWSEVGKLQQSPESATLYTQIKQQAEKADAAEKQRSGYVTELISKLDTDYAVKIAFIDYRRKGLDTELKKLGGDNGEGGLIGLEVVKKTGIDENIKTLTNKIEGANQDIEKNKVLTIPAGTGSKEAAVFRKNHADTQANRVNERDKLQRALEIELAKKQTVDGKLTTIQAEYNRTLANWNYLEAAQQLIVAQYRHRTAEVAFQQEMYAHRQDVLRVRSAQEQRGVLTKNIQEAESQAAPLVEKTDSDSLTKAALINERIISLSDKTTEVGLVADKPVTLSTIETKRQELAASNTYLAQKVKQFEDAAKDADRTFTLPGDVTKELDLDYTVLFGTEAGK